MVKLSQDFRITLDASWQADPVVDVNISGESLQELLDGARNYAKELAAYSHNQVKSVDLINGHTLLGFIKIPL